MTDPDLYLEALFEVHESVIVEREEAKRQMNDDDFQDGHVNGLNEARNRVEEMIARHSRD